MNEESKNASEVGIPLAELPTEASSTDESINTAALTDDASGGPGEPSLLNDLFDPEEFASTGLAAKAEKSPEQVVIGKTDEGAPKTIPAIPSADESDTANPDVDDKIHMRDPQLSHGIADQRILVDHLASLSKQMAELKREFEGKLKYDAHKDQIIDRLHAELQEYKQNILKKYILSIVMDVVKVTDDIRKWLSHYRSLDVPQRDPRKLLGYLEAIPSDLEDVFYLHGVKPFSSHEGIFDPKRHRAIKRVSTNDPALDKCVAASIRPGYEWETKVIRQEMVAVYVQQNTQETTNARMIDE